MIHDVFVLLKKQLNDYLGAQTRPDESREDPVVFLDGQNMEPLTFKLGAVTALLINLEEENILRAPDRYVRRHPDGTSERVQPEIRLNLYVLFVARFKLYEDSLRSLSQIIRYFQFHRVIDHHNTPELSENIEQLLVELVTLPFSAQNEVWSALRVAYHPSVLYKIKMIVFQDEAGAGVAEITEKSVGVHQ